MSAVQTEQVLVVPTELFHSCGYFQGFTTEMDRYLGVLLDPANTSYMTRALAEEDPTFKQLIPYCIFQHINDAGDKTIFQYTRGKGAGEARLHAKGSIGIGGHISTDDKGTESVYDQGMQRELDEEVLIATPFTSECVGMINDDETEVGKVHLGVVHIFTVDEPAVSAREDEIVQSGFLPVSDILDDVERYESWSQICLRALFA